MHVSLIIKYMYLLRWEEGRENEFYAKEKWENELHVDINRMQQRYCPVQCYLSYNLHVVFLFLLTQWKTFYYMFLCRVCDGIKKNIPIWRRKGKSGYNQHKCNWIPYFKKISPWSKPNLMSGLIFKVHVRNVNLSSVLNTHLSFDVYRDVFNKPSGSFRML